MKKLLLAIAILTTFNSYSQNTTTLPTPTTSFAPSYRYYGTLLDSLRQTWMQTPGGGWNRIYTATEIGIKYYPKSKVYTKSHLDSLIAGLIPFTGAVKAPFIVTNAVKYGGNTDTARTFLLAKAANVSYMVNQMSDDLVNDGFQWQLKNGAGDSVNLATWTPDSIAFKKRLNAPSIYQNGSQVETINHKVTTLDSSNVNYPSTSAVKKALTGYAQYLDFANRIQVYRALNLAAWGDSLTAGPDQNGASYPSQLGALAGYIIYNGGVGGETSTQIAARFHADTARWHLPTILWMGRNDYNTPTTVKANIAACITDMASVGNTQYLVVGITTDTTQISGSAGWTTITTYNSQQAVTYGSKFLDILPILVNAYDPSNANDVANHAVGVIPYTLRTLGDATHLNVAGRSVVANTINNTKITQLFPTPPKILTTQSAEGLFANRTNVDLATSGNFSVGGTSVAYVPRQDKFSGSVIYGNGGRLLTHTTASEGYYNTVIGQNTGTALTTGYHNTVGGFNTFLNNTSGYSNSAWGSQALAGNTTGFDNAAIGANSLFINTTGYQNVAIGSNAMHDNIDGHYNAAVGFNALNKNTTGIGNGALGFAALANNTTGGSNVGFGFGALNFNRTGSSNVAIGYGAANGASTASDISSNVFVGYNSGNGILTGSTGNAFVGYQTAYGSANISNNTLIGYQAGQVLATGGNNNTFLGYNAGNGTTTGSGNIVIGRSISTPSITSTNTLNIGNLLYATALDGTGGSISSGNFGVGVKTPLSRLHVDFPLASSGVTNTLTLQNEYTTGNEIPRLAITNSGNVTLGAIDFPLAPNSSSFAMDFSTTSNGGGLKRRMRLDGTGNVIVGDAATPGALFQVTQPAYGPGVISTSGTTVSGSGTQFLNTFKVGDQLTANGETRTISAIASSISMTTDTWTNTNTNIVYTLTSNNILYVQGNQRVGIGKVPSAFLDLRAGTATVGTAPIKFTSGVPAQTVVEPGAINFDGLNLSLGISTVNHRILTDLNAASVTNKALTPNNIVQTPLGTVASDSVMVKLSNTGKMGAVATSGIQKAITLTTTGTGAATLVGNTLNIPTPLISSGTYTPTITPSVNVSSVTAAQCNYMRVGNTVTVSGYFAVTPTAAGGISGLVNITLPVASDLSNNYDLTGTGTTPATSDITNVTIIADPSDYADLQFKTTASTSSQTIYFTFMYQVI